MCEDCSQNDCNSSGLTQREEEALLTEYREMREELRTNITLLHQRLTRGIAAIGFVIGYALLAPDGDIFIATVPVLIAVLFLLSVQSLQTMSAISRHAYDIEESVPAERFGWEHRYGGLLNENKRSTPWSLWQRIDLMSLPGELVIAIGALVYGGFIYVGYGAIDRRVDAVGNVEPALLILAFYIVLTVLLAVVGYSHLIVMNDLQPSNNS